MKRPRAADSLTHSAVAAANNGDADDLRPSSGAPCASRRPLWLWARAAICSLFAHRNERAAARVRSEADPAEPIRRSAGLRSRPKRVFVVGRRRAFYRALECCTRVSRATRLCVGARRKRLLRPHCAPPPSQVAANLQSGPPESPKVVRLGSARLNWARNNAQAEGDAQRRGHRSARVGRHAISAPEAVSHLTIVGFVWRRIGRLCSVPCATLRLLPFWLCGRLFTAPQPLQTALCAHALNCPSVRTPVRRPSKWVRSERRSMGVTLEPKAAHAMNGHNSARSSGGRKCVYLRPLTWPAAAHVRARASRTL